MLQWEAVADDVAALLRRAPSVAAVVIAGSRAAGRSSTGSDLDLFVYTDDVIIDERRALAEHMGDPEHAVLVDVDAFGSCDVWRERRSGLWVDVAFWTPAWADAQLDHVLIHHEASAGYSTAFWRSIATAMPVYERDGWHGALQARARAPFPAALADAIVGLNVPRLRSHPFSFRDQLERAMERGDHISVNHRLAAWLASYFDALFAINRVLHPGEKRMLEVALQECDVLPVGLAEDVEALLAAADPLPLIDRMNERLQPLIGPAAAT